MLYIYRKIRNIIRFPTKFNSLAFQFHFDSSKILKYVENVVYIHIAHFLNKDIITFVMMGNKDNFGAQSKFILLKDTS